jgi:phosphate/sulfate permease
MTEVYNTTPEDDLVWVLVIAVISMCYMAWGIGANDCANNVATTWGAGALSFKMCLAVAAVCEFAGAVFLGNHVTSTFRKGMVSSSLYDGEDGRVLVMAGMTSVLISAATWLLFASKWGLPVSTTHSAVGGVIAFAVVTKGYDSVKWDKVGMIIASWFISPIMSLVCSYFLFLLIKRHVLLVQPGEDEHLNWRDGEECGSEEGSQTSLATGIAAQSLQDQGSKQGSKRSLNEDPTNSTTDSSEREIPRDTSNLSNLIIALKIRNIIIKQKNILIL